MSKPTSDTTHRLGAEGAGRECFLSRRTRGLPHYLWIALAVAFALVFIPRGAGKALQSNSNKAAEWLPAAYSQSADPKFSRDHLANEACVLISWEGCTLGNQEKLHLLAEKLRAETDVEGWSWYPRVITGPDTFAPLTAAPVSLSSVGSLVGPPQKDATGRSLGDESRVTCLLACLDDRLTGSNVQMRRAVERVRNIAHRECGVPLATIHMGGLPVESLAIDAESGRTSLRFAGLAGVVGILLTYRRFRSKLLTASVCMTSGVSAAAGLALVYWYGGFETLVLGLSEPRLGANGALLMATPAVVYMLTYASAIHLLNYYGEERLVSGQAGAVERAVRAAWGPCFVAATAAAMAFSSLAANDVLPVQRFVVFTAAASVLGALIVFSVVPVLLHRFPPSQLSVESRHPRSDVFTRRQASYTRFFTRRSGLTTAIGLVIVTVGAYGVLSIRPAAEPYGLLTQQSGVARDYAWMESRLGNAAAVGSGRVVAAEGVGALMAIGLAIGLAAGDALHFLTWFRRAIGQGLDRRTAVEQACDRCHPAIRQTSLIGFIVLTAFATSAFAPMQQFGVISTACLAVSLVGSLALLPALLCGPLGWFLAPKAVEMRSEGVHRGLPEVVAKPMKPAFVEEEAVAPALVVLPPAKPPAAPVEQPVVAVASPTEPLTPANAALRSKLRKFRRTPSRDAAT